MKTPKILILLFFCTLTLTACWDDSDDMEATPSEDLMRTADIEVGATDTEGTLGIEANCHWTLIIKNGGAGEQWLTLSTDQGNGPAQVRLTTTVNLSPTERIATLQLTTASGIVRPITVRQKGMTGIPGNGDNGRPDF